MTSTQRIADPTAPRTERQTELLTHLARQFYDGPAVATVLATYTTKGEASDAIDKLLAAGGTKPAAARPSSRPGKATDRQVSYAMRLLARGGWYDTYWGQAGGPEPTAAELRRWPARDVSMLIDELR